ncbi:galanin receptor type 1-like [Orbicella faveolata]|uniref:galanin receptor type 1-like n=1 Tax=Orbicella faveolata TaxID=48498 RepID=UPI0009E425EB|nr:galanin receptor type 1-like [Orbicella faveolata]
MAPNDSGLFNKTNFNMPPQQSDDNQQTLPLVAVSLLILITLLGTTGNLLVLRAIFTLKKRNLNDYLILNLAATDTGTCLVSIPLDVVEKMKGEFPYGAALCHVIYPFQSVLVYVSVLTLLFMCVDRYRLIVTPLKPRIHLKTGLTTIAAMWASSCLIVLPLSLALKFKGSHCSEEWWSDYSGRMFTLTIFTFLYLIPMVIMTFLYAFIIQVLYKDTRSLKLRRNVSASSQLSASLPQRNLKIVQVFVMAVVVFGVCMLPTHVTWMWHDFGSGSKRPELFNKAVTFSNILMYANSVVNPVIFGSINVKTLEKLCKALVCYRSEREGSYHELDQVFVLRTNSPSPPDVRPGDRPASRPSETPHFYIFTSSV